MEILHPVVAGMDVHRDTVVVTILKAGPNERLWRETKTCQTFTDQLRVMVAWLDEHHVPIVAMESTGVSWKPLYRVLPVQSPARTVWLINPQHAKTVPGRKTDVSDSHWIAKLLMHGLLAPSFVPEARCLDLRKLTRLRKKLVGDHASLTNRIIKELEESGVKLAGVVTDVMGKSGRAMIDALVAGTQPVEQMADLARGRMKRKRGQLVRALEAELSETPKFQLGVLLTLADEVQAGSARLEQRIGTLMEPMHAEAERLLGGPGLQDVVVPAVLAEIGTDMNKFPSSDHIVSWAGLSPGSRESAGKKSRRGRGGAATGSGSSWSRPRGARSARGGPSGRGNTAAWSRGSDPSRRWWRSPGECW